MANQWSTSNVNDGIHFFARIPPSELKSQKLSDDTRWSSNWTWSFGDLPSSVWSGVVRYLLPVEFAHMKHCMSNLLSRREEEDLWRHYCQLEAFAKEISVASQESSCCRHFDGVQVDWQLCFKRNAEAKAPHHTFACIRVGSHDIRIPALVDEGDDRAESATQCWLFEHCWRPRSLLSFAFRQMIKPTILPLRFRELIDERPGALIRRARFFQGPSTASAVVESPMGREPTGEWRWKNPPFSKDDKAAMEQWEDNPAVRSGPHPWGRGYGWLVELNLKAEERETMKLPAASAPEPRWIHVSKNKPASRVTVKDICNAIEDHLGAMGFDPQLDVLPSTSGQWALDDKIGPPSLLLSDLRWTQGERLHLKEVKIPLHLRRDFTPVIDDTIASDPGARDRASEEQMRREYIGSRAVLFQRDTDRPKHLPTRRRLPEALAELGVKVTMRPQVAVSDGSSSAAPGSSSSGIWTVSLPDAIEDPSEHAFLREDSRQEANTKRRSCQFGCHPDCSGVRCCYCGADARNDEEVVEVVADAREDIPAEAANPQLLPRQRPAEMPEDAPSSSSRKHTDVEWTYTAGELPHERRLILSSSDARQFEFHPTRPNTVLVGRKDGVVSVLDYEADKTTHVAAVDHFPILGLSWLHTNPQWAVCGVSQSGTTCLVHYNEAEDSTPGEMEHVRLEPFHHLSSLSVSCTDEYFITSGFCTDLGLYDIVTGRRINTFRRMHQNFINIARFAHRSPHIFATASFDHTCKLWDLRQPLETAQAIRTFKTDTLNVMCTFSPDDSKLLCSGIDATLQQFSLAKDGDITGSRFPIPAMQSTTNYRRSLYLKGGDLVATVATNESLLRICLAAGPHQQIGHIDLKGSLREQKLSREADEAPARGGLMRANAIQGVLRSWTRGSMRSAGRERGANASNPAGRAARAPRPGGDEYIQSLRSHPTDSTLLGALLSTSDMEHPESYISMLRLGQRKDSSR
mmetsp:Transcript_28541/g.51664  ORF Transcript_28541/g.51664 Transcript_28541/m.51664 type:complete len:972 (+) Transcript_28541:147-3062(+)